MMPGRKDYISAKTAEGRVGTVFKTYHYWFQLDYNKLMIQFCVVSVLRQMKKTYFLMGCIAEEI